LTYYILSIVNEVRGSRIIKLSR